jgi:type VI protein secretion system component VasF
MVGNQFSGASKVQWMPLPIQFIANRVAGSHCFNALKNCNSHRIKESGCNESAEYSENFSRLE